jgi:glycosyltransferase involved in cell wall biosynthesis
MPVFNGEAYLKQAIDSVLQQTYRDFELLIIDDGSTDGSPQIAASYNDPRIRLVTSEKRMTVPNALNTGLDLARGKYVARMDADDECLPDRLGIQFRYMERHGDVALCSGWVRRFGMATGIMRFPVGRQIVRAYVLFDNPFCHPALMMRRDILEPRRFRYDPDYYLAEDYELWARLMTTFQGDNIPEILLNYRVHESGVTQKDWGGMDRQAERVAGRELNRLGINPDSEMLHFHRQIGRGRSCVLKDRNELSKAEQWLIKIWQRNIEACIYNPVALDKVLAEVWFRCCFHASLIGLAAAARFLSSSLIPVQVESLKRAIIIGLAALRAKIR